MTEIEYSLRSAKEPDASKVATLVEAAYSHYVERIGILPRPMTDDYAQFIANQQVTVAESHGSIVVGVIVLNVDEEGFLIDNVAVDPSHYGQGLGKALLEFAEAEADARGSIPFICSLTRRCLKTWHFTQGLGTSSTIAVLRGSFHSST